MRRQTIGLAALLAAWVPGSAAAEDPVLFLPLSFEDTRFIPRHDGQDLPPAMLLPNMTSAAPMNLGRGVAPSDFNGDLKRLAADKDAVATFGYDAAGDMRTNAVYAHQQIDDTTLWGAARRDTVSSYLDGDDRNIAYGYDRVNVQGAVKEKLSPDSTLSVFAMRDAFDNSRLPHYGIDVPRLERWFTSSVYEANPSSGPFGHVTGGGEVTVLSYGGDNYSLRAPGALALSYKARWITARGLVKGEFDKGPFRNAVTLDASMQRYGNPVSGNWPIQGLAQERLPDVEILRTGLSGSSAFDPTPKDHLTAGLRFDAARSHADDADKTPDATGTNASLYNVSPQALWNSYYGGERKNAPVDLTASGRLLYRHDIQDGALKIDIHRDVRIPEAGERFYGSSGPASVVQVGDPELKPEAHHRVDLGAEQGYNGWSGFLTEQATPGSFRLAAGASADRVINFITADRAHGQGGILLNNNAIIYRNVDATVLGATLDGGWQIAPHLGLSGHLDWTHGQNTTDSRALYQIPPLEGKVILEHRESLAEDLAGSLGMRLNFAATQHRVDAYNSTGSGEDTGGQTPGYAVWDLFAGVTVYNHIAISAGIANIFNKEYHPHINPLPDGPTTQPLEAPGRAAFVMASVGF